MNKTTDSLLQNGHLKAAAGLSAANQISRSWRLRRITAVSAEERGATECAEHVYNEFCVLSHQRERRAMLAVVIQTANVYHVRVCTSSP